MCHIPPCGEDWVNTSRGLVRPQAITHGAAALTPTAAMTVTTTSQHDCTSQQLLPLLGLTNHFDYPDFALIKSQPCQTSATSGRLSSFITTQLQASIEDDVLTSTNTNMITSQL